VVGTQEGASASREEMERLGLIRYQLDLALRQAEQAHPLNGFSLLGFQDAVESFLHLAADHIGIHVKSDKFPDYVESVSSKMPDNEPLGYRKALLSLNHARVTIKHHGNLPDQRTIERHQATALAFFDDATPRLFGVSFDSISLSHLVNDEKVRQHLRDAEAAWQVGDALTAMSKLRMAFNDSLEDHLAQFLPTRRMLPMKTQQELGPFLSRLDALDHTVALLSLGIDLRRYYFFRDHTPVLQKALDGSVRIGQMRQVSRDERIFETCQQFVIDTALQVAQALR
jgi:hypothetical protein